MRVWWAVQAYMEDLLVEVCPTALRVRGNKLGESYSEGAAWAVAVLANSVICKRQKKQILNHLSQENGAVGDSWWVALNLVANSKGCAPMDYGVFMAAIVSLSIFPNGFVDIYTDPIEIALHKQITALEDDDHSSSAGHLHHMLYQVQQAKGKM